MPIRIRTPHLLEAPLGVPTVLPDGEDVRLLRLVTEIPARELVHLPRVLQRGSETVTRHGPLRTPTR